MSSPPRVTIITPTFNRAGFLPETVASVLAQDYPNIEYFVIDDGSTDATAGAIRPFLERVPEVVRYLRHDNMGESRTVNRGWHLATGDYVAVVSSDDPVLPGWLSTSVAFMEEHPDVVVGYPDWRKIDEQGHPLKDIQVPEFDLARMVRWFETLPGPGTLIRRAPFRDMMELRNPAFRYVSDYECWLRLALRGPLARIPRTLATWRFHLGAATVATTTAARAHEYPRVMREFFARPDLPEKIATLRRSALSRAWYLAALALGNDHPLRTLGFLARSFVLQPLDDVDLPNYLRRSLVRKFLGYGHLALRRLPGLLLRPPP